MTIVPLAGSDRLVTTLLAPRLAAPERVERAIDAEDEMFLYALELYAGDATAAAGEYFATGLAVLEEVQQLARWRFGGLEKVGRFLDFASGYGRVTRLLLHDLAAERIWAADIYRDAVRFQADRLGVHALASGAEPTEFVCAERFDFVLVSSLFSHLPSGRFEAWLTRLVDSLAPGGLLAFTVHDESLIPTGFHLDASGIAFAAESESRSLDGALYGTSWVSEAFVRRAVAAAGDELSCHRLPRAHGHFQDLYVVVRERDVDFATLAFDPGPRVQLDACVVEKGPRLRLGGWCVDTRDGEAPERLAIVFADRPPIDHRRFLRRIDTPELHGWEVELSLEGVEDPAREPLVLTAFDRGGAATVLHAGSLGSAAMRVERLRGQHLSDALAAAGFEVGRLGWELEVARNRLAAAHASRFWKLREGWFAVKRALRLTAER